MAKTSTVQYKAPSYEKSAFNCPLCDVYAKQVWSDLFIDPDETGHNEREYQEVDSYRVALCTHCEQVSLWYKRNLVYPIVEKMGLPDPNEDLASDIKEDFIEARSILHLSSRGATAILRLCLQKLCKQLGEKGENINDDIASLVKKGLNVRVQQSLDLVRVIGNNAVHPGEINIKDDQQTAVNLLGLINIIAEVMISQPKHIQSLYESLPGNALEAIIKRDKKKPQI